MQGTGRGQEGPSGLLLLARCHQRVGTSRRSGFKVCNTDSRRATFGPLRALHNTYTDIHAGKTLLHMKWKGRHLKKNRWEDLKDFTSSREQTKRKPEGLRHGGTILDYIHSNTSHKIHRKCHQRNDGAEEKGPWNKDTRCTFLFHLGSPGSVPHSTVLPRPLFLRDFLP